MANKKATASDPVTGEKLSATKGFVDEDGFEIIGGDQSEIAVGEVVIGEFRGVLRTLPAKQKGKDPVPVYGIGPRAVIGGTVLKTRIEDGQVRPGDILKITRLEDAPAKKGHNAAKLFDVRVKRATA